MIDAIQFFGEPQKLLPPNKNSLGKPSLILDSPTRFSPLAPQKKTKSEPSKSESAATKHPQSIFDTTSATVILNTTSAPKTLSKLSLSQPDCSAYFPPNINKSQLDSRPEAILTISKVYIMANKYGVQALKHLAQKKYAEKVPKAWNSASFVQSLQLIYDSITNTGAVDPLCELASKYFRFGPLRVFSLKILSTPRCKHLWCQTL